jgi:hypothetical protein
MFKENYKTFEIYELWHDGTYYYHIYRCSERITSINLASVKACRNVIDTYLKSNKELNNLIESIK